MTEAMTSEEPVPRRLLPILLVVATIAVSSWACGTALERLGMTGPNAHSSVSAPLNPPADRLDRP